MALVFADRVRETTSTAGTGTFFLIGAVNSCQSFSAIGNGNTTYYTAVSQAGTEWEVGIGTYTSGTLSLSRDTILASSNGGAIVNFSAGTKDVFCDYPAGKAVLIDGSGNTYAPNIGGTTASAGTFTNGTLKGTGQNLLVQSQTFNTTWSNTALTINQTATTAPNGTSTGNSLTPTAVSSIHRINSPSLNNVTGVTYTASVYAKANGYNYLYFNCQSAFNANSTFNLATGVVSGTSNGTATITSVGSGWYRCTITGTAVSTSTSVCFLQVNSTQSLATDDTFTGDGTSGIYLWGAQLEIGSTANTYIPTTTTVVYGTPSLSFAGVAGIGLQSDGSLYVSPAGSGALQAQATTSTAAGGNARGVNAVDWQTLRSVSTKVASGIYSTISGGQQHTASGTGAFIGGGYQNIVTAYEGAVVAGSSNVASNFQNFVGGGSSNNVSGSWAVIVGGFGNASAGQYNFVGGGYVNAGTSSTAVTTQSATMNGTTAVTLSGSNAAIKVGQYIAGTSIPSNTYVAAVSGTSLTLSQAASGSTTNNISFYNAHGVVVGGGNNQATGAYSFIGGGGDAGTSTNRNVASGDWSFVGGGRGSVASGYASVVVGGGSDTSASALGSTASGVASTIVGGLANFAYGTGSAVLGGYQNQAAGDMTTTVGGRYGTSRSIVGMTVLPACNVPIGSLGVSQSAVLVLGVQTTDATATVLRSNSSAATTTNQVILPNNSAYYFKGSVIANVTGAANGAAWSFEGAIMRGANAASTVIIGTVTINRVAVSAGATAWSIALTADTTNGGLAITVTGVAATTIRWVAKVETTEVTY